MYKDQNISGDSGSPLKYNATVQEILVLDGNGIGPWQGDRCKAGKWQKYQLIGNTGHWRTYLRQAPLVTAIG